MCRRPFPTIPKFWEVPTAIRDSLNGLNLTEKPLNGTLKRGMVVVAAAEDGRSCLR